MTYLYHGRKVTFVASVTLFILLLFPPANIHAQTWVQLSKNTTHTAAIRSDGTLWTWGLGTSGQLGYTLVSNARTTWPVQVGTATNWKQVGCGDIFTVALKTDGTIWSWGDNTFGELGDGTTTNHTTPTQVGVATNWTAIACGANHVLALRSDGTLWAWGSNTNNQLSGAGGNQTSPVQIGAATNWAKIFCGIYSSYAIKTDGTLWAWGNNLYGLLGLGVSGSPVSTVTKVGAATNWSQVAAGMDHAVAYRTDGTIWSAGRNINGELGLGNNTQFATFQQVGAATNWAGVGAEGYASYAVKTDGSLYACGLNSNGELGLGNTTNFNTFQLVSGSVAHPVQLTTWGFAAPNTSQQNCGYIESGGNKIFCTGQQSTNGNFGEGTVSNTTSFNYSASLTEICSSIVFPPVPSTITHSIYNYVQTSGNKNTIDFIYPGCYSLLSLTSAGASPVSARVYTNVWVESSLPIFNGIPYLARHFEIVPFTNPSTTTGTVTLYCTQAEFDAYNAAKPTSYPSMPVNTSDVTNAANIRVTRLNGATSNGTGLPGTYTAGTGMAIVPSAAIYNTVQARWEISFSTTGFGGFFIHTNPWMVALPLKLETFTAQANNNCGVELNWTISGIKNGDKITVERSPDGDSWYALNKTPLNENNTTGSQPNTFTDVNPLQDICYYRLLLENAAGDKNYSFTSSVKTDCKVPHILIYPTVTPGEVTIVLPAEDADAVITIANMAGQTYTIPDNRNNTICKMDISCLPKGIYIISYRHLLTGTVHYAKVVKL